MKSGSLNLLEPSGPVKVCNGIALPLIFLPFTGKYSQGTLLVAQLVEALRYKPEGRGFYSR
jgi:hypothetical protein